MSTKYWLNSYKEISQENIPLKIFKFIKMLISYLIISAICFLCVSFRFLRGSFKYLRFQVEGSDEGWEESNQPIVGIDWSAGEKAVTQGIWMYIKSIIHTQPDKRKVTT